MFRSPTCTPKDEEVAKELAEIAGVDYEELAISMFEAGSNFNGKTTEEIVYTDFKTFNSEGRSFGVSQVSAISVNQLRSILPDIKAYLPTMQKEKGVDMVFVMLTCILEQGSEVLFNGNEAERVLSLGFGKEKMKDELFDLPGVVSRKKQMVPNIIEGIQQLD
jgi:manganese-dependent inorganic pyrophosphatase